MAKVWRGLFMVEEILLYTTPYHMLQLREITWLILYLSYRYHLQVLFHSCIPSWLDQPILASSEQTLPYLVTFLVCQWLFSPAWGHYRYIYELLPIGWAFRHFREKKRHLKYEVIQERSRWETLVHLSVWNAAPGQDCGMLDGLMARSGIDSAKRLPWPGRTWGWDWLPLLKGRDE